MTAQEARAWANALTYLELERAARNMDKLPEVQAFALEARMQDDSQNASDRGQPY